MNNYQVQQVVKPMVTMMMMSMGMRTASPMMFQTARRSKLDVYQVTKFGHALSEVVGEECAIIEVEQLKELRGRGFDTTLLLTSRIYKKNTDGSYVASGRYQNAAMIFSELEYSVPYSVEELRIWLDEPKALTSRDIDALVGAGVLYRGPIRAITWQDNVTGKKYSSIHEIVKAIAREYGIDPWDRNAYSELVNKDPWRIKKIW